MRYIITCKKREDEGKRICLLSFAAEIADSAEQASHHFEAAHPDMIALDCVRVDDGSAAFLRYGTGAWTDEVAQAHREKLDNLYDAERVERQEAEIIVSTYEPDEFEAVHEYMRRRASETSPNLEGVHVGDLFYVEWGYEQTNYTFFQVVGLRGKHTIIVRESQVIRAKYESMRGLIRPIRNQFVDETRYTLRTRCDERMEQGIWINAPEAYGSGHGLRRCNDGQRFDYTSYA